MRKSAIIPYLGAVFIIIGMWYVFSLLVGQDLLPGPRPTFIMLFRESGRTSFWLHIWASGYRVVAGLVCAFITAVPLGLLLGGSHRLDRLFTPLVYLSYPIPKIVFLPIVLMIFGLGDTGKIVLIALIIFFQLLITTRDSARQVGTEMIYAFKSLGGNRRNFFRHVVWPVSLPGIFTSLRVGTGIAVAVLFFVESIGTREGLGFYIIDAWGRADYTAMFVGIIGLSGIGILLYEIFDLLEKRVCQWKRA
ncbi:MAG: ABC transporter permease [Thermodesulfobacteriota bacterium]|nr:ABC transporter permease [Thermodesulfobacteriota bacterium]